MGNSLYFFLYWRWKIETIKFPHGKPTSIHKNSKYYLKLHFVALKNSWKRWENRTQKWSNNIVILITRYRTLLLSVCKISHVRKSCLYASRILSQLLIILLPIYKRIIIRFCHCLFSLLYFRTERSHQKTVWK